MVSQKNHKGEVLMFDVAASAKEPQRVVKGLKRPEQIMLSTCDGVARRETEHMSRRALA